MLKKIPSFRVATWLLILLLIFTCKQRATQEEVNSTSYVPDTTSETVTPDYVYPETPAPEKNQIIDYRGDSESLEKLKLFHPFQALSLLAAKFIRTKDSLRAISESELKNHEKIVHEAILRYKRNMEDGNLSDDGAPTLLNFNRHVGPTDSTFCLLPQTEAGSFLNGRNFFFLGGAPMIANVYQFDSSNQQQVHFTDSDGNPELRFQALHTSNMSYLLKSIINVRKPKIEITFGGPLETYDGPLDEVNGIGSVIHNFVEEIPAYFLTENGIVPARLKYYDVPFTEHYRCYSSFPKLVFGCSKYISSEDILGIYIPYDNELPEQCTINRESKWFWTADLNGDSIPEIACAIGTQEDDDQYLLEILWFVNINGEWKIIDYGAQPFCT